MNFSADMPLIIQGSHVPTPTHLERPSGGLDMTQPKRKRIMVDTCKWVFCADGDAFGPACTVNGSFWIRGASLDTLRFCPLCGKLICTDGVRSYGTPSETKFPTMWDLDDRDMASVDHTSIKDSNHGN